MQNAIASSWKQSYTQSGVRVHYAASETTITFDVLAKVSTK